MGVEVERKTTYRCDKCGKEKTVVTEGNNHVYYEDAEPEFTYISSVRIDYANRHVNKQIDLLLCGHCIGGFEARLWELEQKAKEIHNEQGNQD